MPDEFTYERECNEIDEEFKKCEHNVYIQNCNLCNTKKYEHIICCQGCYKLGKKDMRKEILELIETERDNGNLNNMVDGNKGFSASLCLSKLMKELEK